MQFPKMLHDLKAIVVPVIVIAINLVGGRGRVYHYHQHPSSSKVLIVAVSFVARKGCRRCQRLHGTENQESGEEC